MNRLLLLSRGFASIATVAGGATLLGAPPTPPAYDRSRDSLLHPTPKEFLREMSTDRPDKTESAYSVDAGHFQVEMDLVTYTRDRDRTGGGDVSTDAWSVAPINLKVGLLHDVDLQLILEPHHRVRTHDRIAGTVVRQSGFGDTTVRIKKNFWGNDGGPSALAMMPYVKLPTHDDGLGNDAVEGGITFPLALELPAGWSLGAMTQVDVLRNDTGSGHHAGLVNTVTFGHDLIGKLAGYVEFFSEVSTQRGDPWVGTVDLGLTYGLTENLQLDAGINLGVTRSADDFNPFLGLSWRF